MEVIVARAAGLDVNKDTVTTCVRAPDPGGGRRQEVRELRTFTHDLRRLRAWLVDQAVTHVAMEATGVHSRGLAVTTQTDERDSTTCLTAKA